MIKHVQLIKDERKRLREYRKRGTLLDFIAHGSQKLLMDGHVELSIKAKCENSRQSQTVFTCTHFCQYESIYSLNVLFIRTRNSAI